MQNYFPGAGNFRNDNNSPLFLTNVYVMNPVIFNSVSYIDIKSVCLQRTRRQQLMKPPMRSELQNTPYDTYSEEQLNMRRKCEILKYATPATKTNRLTKQQQFVQLVNGNLARRNYTNNQLQVGACADNHNYVPTSSTSCGIPGPGITLILDPTVPLYNYKPQNTAPSSIPVEESPPFETFIGTDIVISRIYPTELFVLYIGNTIPMSLTPFRFSIPFTISTNLSGDIKITQVYVYVYYNSTVMTSNDVYGIYNNGFTPLISEVPVVSTVLEPRVGNTYRGVLYVDNMQVYSTPGFVLDVKVLFVTNPNYGVDTICNPTGGGSFSIETI